MKPVKKMPNPSWFRRAACRLGFHVWDVEAGAVRTATGERRDRRRCRHCLATQVRVRSGSWVG